MGKKRLTELKLRSKSEMVRVDTITSGDITIYAEAQAWTRSMAIYQLILKGLESLKKKK